MDHGETGNEEVHVDTRVSIVLAEGVERVVGVRQALASDDLDLLRVRQSGDESYGLLVGFFSYAEIDCEVW
jgi:hypothetical protein